MNTGLPLVVVGQFVADNGTESMHPTHIMYAVRFDGVELWGDQAETNSSVVLDMWESYLEEEVATDGE